MKNYGSLTVLFYLSLLTSCREPCDPASEPYAHLSVSSDSLGNRYQKAYLLNSIRPNANFDLSGLDSIPLSITSDSTVFVLQSPTRMDTVGISYTRDIAYQAQDCGFVVVLKDLKILNLTTIVRSNIDIQVRTRQPGGLFMKSNKTIYQLHIYF